MKQLFKQIISTLCVIILFFCSANIWKYILIDDYNSYTRIMMHQMYNSEQNIDVLLLGSSHVYRSLIPEILDQSFGKYTFNAGSSSQFMDASYALLKEVAKTNDIQQVYLELYHGVPLGEPYKERSSLTSTYIISDYMKPSLNKIDFLINASDKEHWINSFLIAKRNWSYFFDFSYVKSVIEHKKDSSYREYLYTRIPSSTEYYVDRGYVANDGAVAENIYINTKAYGKINVDSKISKNKDWQTSLKNIITYCKKKDIELVFFIAPEPEWTLVGKSDYQDYHDYVTNLAHEYGVKFYNFNLVRNNIFDTNDKSNFKDEDHLNSIGAKKFSILFGDFFSGKYKSTSIFYDSFDAKIDDEKKPFYGLAGPAKSDDGSSNEYYIISGNKECEYKIIAIKKNGDSILVQDFDKNTSFKIPILDTIGLQIIWRNNKENSTGSINFQLDE